MSTDELFNIDVWPHGFYSSSFMAKKKDGCKTGAHLILLRLKSIRATETFFKDILAIPQLHGQKKDGCKTKAHSILMRLKIAKQMKGQGQIEPKGRTLYFYGFKHITAIAACPKRAKM